MKSWLAIESSLRRCRACAPAATGCVPGSGTYRHLTQPVLCIEYITTWRQPGRMNGAAESWLSFSRLANDTISDAAVVPSGAAAARVPRSSTSSRSSLGPRDFAAGAQPADRPGERVRSFARRARRGLLLRMLRRVVESEDAAETAHDLDKARSRHLQLAAQGRGVGLDDVDVVLIEVPAEGMPSR